MSEGFQGFLLFALVAAAIVAVLLFGRRRGRGKVNAKDTGADSEGPAMERRRLTKAIRELEVNLMEFGRDIEGRLDTRIHTLQELLKRADETIDKLEQLNEGKPGGYNGTEGIPPLHREVYQLADDGLDKVEIARRTSITPGEVNLILGLRRTRTP